MKVLLFGRDGKVGSTLAPRLVEAGHEVTGVDAGEEPPLEGQDAAIDFTAPGAVLGNMRLAVATARRGWATADDVLNTRPLEAVLGRHRAA